MANRQQRQQAKEDKLVAAFAGLGPIDRAHALQRMLVVHYEAAGVVDVAQTCASLSKRWTCQQRMNRVLQAALDWENKNFDETCRDASALKSRFREVLGQVVLLEAQHAGHMERAERLRAQVRVSLEGAVAMAKSMQGLYPLIRSTLDVGDVDGSLVDLARDLVAGVIAPDDAGRRAASVADAIVRRDSHPPTGEAEVSDIRT
jgi:hypothetical protein